MKLHLPSGLRNAVLSCMALVSSVLPATLSAGALVGGVCMLTMQETQAAFVTNTTPDPDHEYSEDVLYAGNIYDIDANQSSELHSLLPTDVWKNFCSGNNAPGDDGHTLRISSSSATGQNITLTTTFAPFTLGGLIVEKSDNTYTIGRNSDSYTIELQAATGQDVNFLILSDTTFVGHTTTPNMVNIHNTTNWRVGSGNTLTWTSPLTLVLQNNCKLNIINYATGDSANPANVVIQRMLSMNPGSSLNIGRGTALSLGSGDPLFAALSTAMTTTVNVAAGGTLNLNGILQLAGHIYNEGTINFTAGGKLVVRGYDSRTFTKDHAYYHLTLIEGNGVVNNWDTLELSTYFGQGWTTTQNGYTIVFERDVKEVDLAELAWSVGATLNSQGETYETQDALWFSTDTVATLTGTVSNNVELLKLTAAYIEKGHTLTISEASTGKLSIAGELLLGGDLVLTKAGQVHSGYIFSQGGRLVFALPYNSTKTANETDFAAMLPSGVDYSGTVVIRKGRINSNGLSNRHFQEIIVEDGGQFYLGSYHYTGDITIAGSGYCQENDSRPEDTQAAIRFDGGGQVIGTVHLSDDAVIQAWGNGTINGAINGHNHRLDKHSGSTLTVNGNIIDVSHLHVIQGGLIVNGDVTGSSEISMATGTLTINGTVDGTDTINLSGGTMTINGTLVNTDAALNIAGGTLIVTQNWDGKTINKTGNGTLRFTGKVTTGDVTFSQAGTIEFLGEVDGTGTLTIDRTTVKLGTAQAHTNAFHYDTVHVLTGGAFHVQHSAADYLDTSITLEGGTLRMVDMDEDGDNHDTTMNFKELRIQGGSETTSAIEFNWNGGFSFQRLTGDGNFTIKKEQNGPGEVSTLAFDEVYNYSGTISWLNGDNHNRLTLKIGSVHQDDAYSASVVADVTSSDLVMTGAGSFSITGNLTADSVDVQGSGELTITGNVTADSVDVQGSGELTITGSVTASNLQVTGPGRLTINGNATSNIDMTGLGTLTVTGTLTSADFRVRSGNVTVGLLELTGDLWMNYDGTLTLSDLHIGKNTNLRYSESESSVLQLTNTEGNTGWITSGNLTSGIVYIYTYDLSAEALAHGVCLGLSSTGDGSIDKASIAVLGLSFSDYELYEGSDGSWYLRANNGASADPLGTDGMWDAAWGNELSRRPTEAIPEASGFTTHPDGQTQMSTHGIWLARDEQYSSRGGLVRWAKLTEDTTANETAPLYVFGGDVNSNNTNSPTTLTTDVWIDIEGGHYAVVAGGFDARDNSTDANVTTFNGNVHLVQQAGATTDRLIGGSYGTGKDTNFNGDTYISVFGGSVDSIIGGSAQDNTIANSEHTINFRGDSHIFIYDVLEKTEVPSSAPYDQSHNFIVGGNAHLNRSNDDNYDISFTGTSSIIIDLGNKYANTRSGMEFGKLIIGGDIVTGKRGNLNHTGDTYVYITGAEGVTFTERIFGGSYDDGNSISRITGSTYVVIDSGIYANMIVGGSNQGVLDATDGNLTSGTVGADPSTTITGDTNILITGGEFRGYDSTLGTNRDNTDNHSIGNVAIVGGSYHSEVGNTSSNRIDSGTINGNTNITIIDGRFLGHIAGASAFEGMPATGGLGYYHTALSVGSSNVTMLGGEMVKNPGDSDVDPNDWVPRIVGGFLLHSAAGNRTQGSEVSRVIIGDINVTIGGSAITYDVIGGSWTSCLNAIDWEHKWKRVTHGNITVNLTGTATIKGDVYAAGIQGGAAGMDTGSTTVNIGSGVVFDKELGDFTIVSGGYLSTSKTNHGSSDAPEWEENQDAYGSFYATNNDTTSSVTGKRTLNLTDAVDYGTSLSNVRLLNFDEVNVKSGAEVTVESLFITEAGLDSNHQSTTLAGGGTLSLQGKLIEIPNGTDATQQVLNNGSIIVTDGSTLHFLSSGHTGDRAISYVNHVEVEDGSTLQLDLDHQYATSNDRVYVSNGIEVHDNGSIVVNVRMTQDMFGSALGDALITRMPGATTQQPALTLNNAYFELNFHALDLMTDAGKTLNFVVADYVVDDGNTTFNTGRNGSLYKWFGYNANITVEDDDATDLKRIVFSGTVVSADTADYHQVNAISANGYSGGRLLDALYSTKNPEYNTPTSDGAQLLSALESMLNAGDIATADRTMAAAAGASVAALGSALNDDVERQLRAIRNRTTTMISEYSEETLNMNFWLNAEGDYRKLQGNNTDSGYKLNSWGGTVGVSAQVSESSTLGVALTAMYGDFEAQAPDKLKGDLNTSYLSAFARVADGNWNHIFVATAGLATVDAKRTVQHTYGSYTNKVDTEGYTVGLLYEVGYTMMLNETGTTCLQPMMNISWRHSQLNSFTEPDSDVGLQVSDQTYDAVTVGAGMRVQSVVGEDAVNRSAILEARALLKGYFGDARNSATVGFVDLPQRVSVRSRDLGHVGVELGAGLTLPITSSGESAIFIDASAEIRNSYTNFNATIGWKTTF